MRLIPRLVEHYRLGLFPAASSLKLRLRLGFDDSGGGTGLAGVKREFAHVHDVQIKWAKSLGRREDTGTGPVEFRGEKEQVEGLLKGDSMSRNVFKQPLALHSTQPITGFTRSGYCEVPKTDAGNHSVAGIVTNEFLDFSAARGNDLRQIGLKDGCKWCLCVNRWKEAFSARTGDDDKKVPKIVLKATNERALDGVSLDDLKKFAVDKE